MNVLDSHRNDSDGHFANFSLPLPTPAHRAQHPPHLSENLDIDTQFALPLLAEIPNVHRLNVTTLNYQMSISQTNSMLLVPVKRYFQLLPNALECDDIKEVMSQKSSTNMDLMTYIKMKRRQCLAVKHPSSSEGKEMA